MRTVSSFLTVAITGVTMALVACGGGSGSSDGGSGDGGSALPDAATALDASFVFDEATIRTFDLTVADSDWQWLNDNAQLEQWVPATLRYAGQSFDQVAVRYKGGYGSLFSCFDGAGNRTCDKLSIKLKFSEYDLNKRFYGLKRINLHGMNSDKSKMHDAIGYRLFRDAGVFAPRTAFARIKVNGELLGLFIAVESVDGQFTRNRFPDGGKGNLYKEVWPVHTTQQPYIDALETNEDENPSADKMVRFAAALQAAGDSGFESTMASWTDLDKLVSYMAVARLIDHWDGTVGWYCVGGPCFNHNYYWYESTAADKIWIVPWDLDHTLEEPSPIRTYFGMPDWDDVNADCTPIVIFAGARGRAPACDDILRRMATQLWDRYETRSNELLAGDFSIAALDARIDQLESLISAAVAEDPVLDLDAWHNAVDGLRTAVRAKRSHVMGKFN